MQKHRVEAYHNLQSVLDDLNNMQLVEVGLDAYYLARDMPSSVRCGTNDRTIAAIAITNNYILVTANVQDFEKIANLKIEDWTVRPLE